MKKLLIITNSYPDTENRHYGGIFVKEQVRYLKDYFENVYVISPQPWGPNRNLRDYEYDNVRVYYPRFFHAPVEFFRKRLGDSFFKAALRIIKREKLEFDLIHAHFTWPSGYASILLKQKIKVPVIVTAHGNDVRIPLTNYIQSFDNAFLRLKLNEVVENADVILTHHEELRDLLLSSYPQLRHKVRFIYKGINLKRFNPFSKELKRQATEMRKSLRIDDKFVVLFLARLDWDKDPLTFVEAAKLLREHEEITFLIVGGGSLFKKCVKEKTKHDLKNLYIIGPRNDTEVWYALADVFVALSPVENIWSTTLQEALVVGLPAIVTSAGYTPKILRDNVDVLMIPPKNPKALAEAIMRLLKDEGLKERLSQNAIKWRNQFDNSKITKEILNIYQAIRRNSS
ncbi:MAG TPA: glycosyltransferase family 4 protein [Thermococcaceae archaeon]|nr:glycosyltransferase family 4 protein [Methanomassiliicoccales archaeon]HII67649.1 glycosyltransferase family 4 protein [Thermococcaceae archaeon]